MRMYVVCRNDLSISQKAVQSGHAIAEYLLKNPKTDWDNGTMVFLKVENEKELIRTKEKLEMKGKNVVCFREPDIGDQMTAFALVSDVRILNKLKLL